jgi:acyl-CoA synthetase (AMP-forming)/AMP-acid ligase II
MRQVDDSDLLLDRLASNAASFADKRAVAWLSSNGDVVRELSYRELQSVTDQLANRLLESGIAHGDRAVLVYPPSLDFMVAFLACVKAGVVAVPVFPPNPTRRDTLNMFAKIVRGCGAHVALTNTEYSHVKKLASIRDAIQLKSTSAVWPEELTWILTDDNKKQARKKTTQQQQQASGEPFQRSDLAFLQYTSGSTSDPKGVMITHENLAHNLRIITNELQATETVVVVSWLPQYHDMGLIGSYLGTLYCGGTGYYMSPLTFLQRPMLWLEAVSKYRATHLQAPNFAFKLTSRKFQPANYATKGALDLSSVQHIINAAEPVDQASMDSFYQSFGPFGLQKVIFPTYGLAEHTVFVCSGGKQILTLDKQALEVDGKVVIVSDNSSGNVSHLVGCGYPAKQNVTVKIVDTQTTVALADDLVGEIWVNSPSKAAGYFGMEQETKDDFHAKISASELDDEYLRTGDLGFLHNGELFICGRLKDLIIIGGRNYYPQDIEATAEASSDRVRPGCSAAFTIDTTHEGGEEVGLVMELKEVMSESACQALVSSIRAAVNQEHALGLAVIVFVQPRTNLKTSSGKIARRMCRKALASGSLKMVYHKSFKSSYTPLETEAPTSKDAPPAQPMSAKDSAKIRELSKEEILAKLITDMSRMGSIPEESIEKNTSIASMLDSLTVSQFKGLLENRYATKLSDEYLFRESTTPQKLVEVVKLGYAPDDDGNEASANLVSPTTGKAPGLAGALGCPPGVVCTIL